MSLNNEQRANAGMSTTMLTQNCARKVILQMTEDYHEHPSEMYQRTRGTVHHLLMEQYGDGLEPYIAEIRFRKTIEVDGVEFPITGKMDAVLLDDAFHKSGGELIGTGTIIDYKSTGDTQSEWKPIRKRIAQEEHIAQVNIYSWLLWGGESLEDDVSGQELIQTGDKVWIDIGRAGVGYLDMKGQKKVGAPIWPREQTEEYIRKTLKPHAHYRKTGELPPILENLWGERHVFCNYCAVRDICDKKLEQGE